MGIRTFSFNGESSDTYGVMITQNESYNAPARAGEMISIPGRNGAYWHDLGRFENIEVTYKCAIGEGTKADFVDAMSDIRSWLCSPVGYCRLEDDYNPNEYRLAVYKSGLETDKPLVTGAEFDIVFECKPQRFLKSGETAISVTSGDTITNPTLFDAKPLLEIYGYGTVGINGAEIEIADVDLGDVALTDRQRGVPLTLDVSMLNVGDTIRITGGTKIVYYKANPPATITGFYLTSQTGCSASVSGNSSVRYLTAVFDDFTFVKGTASTQSCTAEANISVKKSGTTTTTSVTVTNTFTYDGDNKITGSASLTSVTNTKNGQHETKIPQVFGYSTKPATGTPLYIDLDIGECYNLDFGPPISANNAVVLPAELPVLASGENTITYNNTVTQLDIIPRWWSV